MALQTPTQLGGPEAWAGQDLGLAGWERKLLQLPRVQAAAGQPDWALRGAAGVGAEVAGSPLASPCIEVKGTHE